MYTWSKSVIQTLKSPASTDAGGAVGPRRVAVLGIGQELRGDDAAGLKVAQRLWAVREPVEEDAVMIIQGGPAPENQTGTLRRFGPDLVIMVDAAEMGDPPGTVRWLDWQEITGITAVGHALPLHVLADYLVAELGCRVCLLGIQPTTENIFSDEIGAPLSQAVSQAVRQVVGELAELL